MKGAKKGEARRKGKPNKLTQSARDAFAFAFQEMGGGMGLAEWAKENKTEFYKLYARLIPVEVVGKDGEALPIGKVVFEIVEAGKNADAKV